MPYKNIEDKRKHEREYYQKNKQKKLIKCKEYNEKNKEKIKEYKKEWSKSEIGKKSHTISGWKSIGLIHDNYEELYDKYLDTTNCEICKYVFNERNWRCMDHNHKTGLFRQILCNNCNMFDRWEKLKF